MKWRMRRLASNPLHPLPPQQILMLLPVGTQETPSQTPPAKQLVKGGSSQQQKPARRAAKVVAKVATRAKVAKQMKQGAARGPRLKASLERSTTPKPRN